MYEKTGGQMNWVKTIPDDVLTVKKCPVHESIADSELYDHLLTSEDMLLNLIGLHILEKYGNETYMEYLEKGYEFTGVGKERKIKIKTDKLTKQFSNAEKKALKDFIKDSGKDYGVKYNKEVDI